MKILITGASGFLGRYLIEHLRTKDPENAVFTVCRNPLTQDGASHTVMDLNDEKELDALVNRIRPNQIYHLAGIARIHESISVPDYFNNNTKSTIHLLRALKQLTQPVSLFFSSSVHVYGNQTETITEESPLHPLSAYAFTKYLAEEAIRSHVAENPNLSAVVGRLYSCFGPKQPEGFVAADLCKKILELSNSPDAILKVGPLKSYRRFLDVRDTVSVFLKLLEAKQKNRFEIFNLASPHELQIGEMLTILLQLSNKNPKIESTETVINQFKGLQINTDKLHRFISPSHFRPVKETLGDMMGCLVSGS